MVLMLQGDLQATDWKSSKGNQLKWKKNDVWYKADYTGYEGLAEYVVSRLLSFSDLKENEYVLYDTEELAYKRSRYLGCRSNDFTKNEWQIITLERLFRKKYGESFLESIYKITDYENRMKFLVEQVVRMTGLADFGVYLSKLLAIDAIFLNEDRHLHNIAVLMNGEGDYRYCPIFDNGGALLSDTVLDYPLDGNLEEMIGEVQSKTICTDFDEQLDIVEKLYGRHIIFSYSRKDVENLLGKESYYSVEEKDRVLKIVVNQMRKYQYLFK